MQWGAHPITVADVEVAVAAAIVQACNVGGAMRELVRPFPFGTTSVFTLGPDFGGGATRYELVAAVPGKLKLTDLILSTDIPVVWSIWSSNAFIMIGDHPLAPGEPFKITAGTLRTYTTNIVEAIILRVSDLNAVVTASWAAVLTDDP